MRVTLHSTTRLTLAEDSLTGLSVGDALGAQYFVPGNRVSDLLAGTVPPPVWEWTDDTEMACSVVWMLGEAGAIEPDRLAAVFADRCEPYRGYGVGAFIVLRQIRQGLPWSEAAAAAFDGQGSCGNGAAMRVAPLGAYHADSPERAADQAAAQARLTHAHPEGVAGAIAVAVAASVATAARLNGRRPAAGEFLDAIRTHVPAGKVRSGLGRARRMIKAGIDEAAYELGNGSGVTAQDTVPFALWVAARHLDDYPAAIRTCIRAGGDIDTTGAITGGVVAGYTGRPGIPEAWLESREPLPEWSGVRR
jgi:ADP-ribosylglycohydrolase